MQAVARRIARVDLDQAAQATAILSAVATGNELDRAHEIRVNHGAETAEVIEQRYAHAVHVNARVLGRRAPRPANSRRFSAHHRRCPRRGALDPLRPWSTPLAS